jgi:hypothetical protein
MRKLTLKVDGLKVDSFETAGEEARKGTVMGNDTIETEWCTGYPDCVSRGCQTPNNTCYGTCGCTKHCETATIACA